MKKIAIRGAAVAAAAGVALGALSSGAANADTLIPLRDSVKSAKIGSGGTITISVKGQKAKLSPGMVALPTTRNAWVSGVISAKVSGDADGGTIEAGYAVGCQVDVGSAGVQLGAGVSTGDDDGYVFSGGSFTGLNPAVKGTTGGSIKLAAGSIGTQSLTYDRKSWPKPGDEISPSWNKPKTDFDFKGSGGSFAYSDQTIGVDGCAGYAQARLYVIVAAQVGNSQGTVLLWGDKFTLG